MKPIDRYTCEETLRRLDDYVDRQLSPRERQLVHEHLETCAACAREHAFTLSTLQTLKAKLRRIDVPVDLRSRISVKLASVRTDP